MLFINEFIYSNSMRNNPAIDALRQLGGIATAAQLLLPTHRSQPTISRLLRDAESQIVRLGRGPSARYAIPESIFSLPAQMPLYWNGKPWGQLTYIMGNRIHVSAAGVDVLTQGELPWFLDNFRLQGFLGRAWARRLGFDPNPETWSLAQILFTNAQYAFDAPGAISAGRADAGTKRQWWPAAWRCDPPAASRETSRWSPCSGACFQAPRPPAASSSRVPFARTAPAAPA